MTTKYSSPRNISIFGIFLVAMGILGYLEYLFGIIIFERPQNPTLILAQTAIFASGCLAIVVANCLKSIEARIQELEKARAPE